MSGFNPLGLFGDVLSAGVNIFNQERTNKSNRDINQMNNEFNAMEAQKSRDFARDMWEQNNRYNSPENQVSRLRAAGLNPALALGQVASGQVSSNAGTPSGASSSGNAQMHAAQIPMLGQSFRDTIRLKNESKLADSQSAKIDAEAEQQVMDNQTRLLENYARLDNLITNTKDVGLKADAQKIQNNFLNDMLGADYKNKLRQGNLIDAQIRETVSRAVYQELINENFPEQFKLQCGEMAASIAEKYASKELTEKQVKTEVQRELETIAKTNQVKLDNKLKDKIMPYVIRHAKENQGSDSPWQMLDNIKRNLHGY